MQELTPLAALASLHVSVGHKLPNAFVDLVDVATHIAARLPNLAVCAGICRFRLAMIHWSGRFESLSRNTFCQRFGVPNSHIMPQCLVECVPNFSEGRDRAKIEEIAGAVRAVAGVQLLDVDAGPDANRTVVTFVGPPEAVAEAAFRAIAKAAEVIDMRVQQGSHPRIGATDVCPFIPVEGATMGECVEIARQVGRRVADELAIPVYLYEAAAASPERQNLAAIRKGEYEGLAEKLRDPRWAPDFGKPVFNPRSGVTVIGARDFLIAYNITLNTRDRAAATDIAFELREKGRAARTKTASPYYQHGEPLLYQEGRYPCGNCDFVGKTFAETEAHCRAVHGYEPRKLAESLDGGAVVGKKVPRAGKFKFCKAIGWYAEGYKRSADFDQPDELSRHAAAPRPGGGPQAGGRPRPGRDGQRGRGPDSVCGAFGRRAVLPAAARTFGARANGRYSGNGRLLNGSERRAAV